MTVRSGPKGKTKTKNQAKPRPSILFPFPPMLGEKSAVEPSNPLPTRTTAAGESHGGRYYTVARM